MSEIAIPASELRRGDLIDNFCAILVDITVESVDGEHLTLRRPDGSTFDLTFPGETLMLVREPRSAERRAA